MSKNKIKFLSWDFGDYDNSMFNFSTESNPTHEYSKAAIYHVSLQVQDSNGCRDTIVKLIQVQSEYTFYVPNAFTPNQDGLNDFFNVHGTGFDFNTFHLSIYTRWGELIFTSNDINNGWDGKKKGEHQLCPIGTYVWHVSFTTIEGEKKVYTGLVTLIL